MLMVFLSEIDSLGTNSILSFSTSSKFSEIFAWIAILNLKFQLLLEHVVFQSKLSSSRGSHLSDKLFEILSVGFILQALIFRQ